MNSTVECPGCRRSYDVPAAHRGRAVRCKQCGTAFTLDATDTVNAPSSPALATLVAQAVVEGSAQPGVSDRPAASESPAASSKPSPATGGAKSDPAGRTIGRFRLGVRLGQGAYGAVYRAFDTVLQREVALKLPLARALESPEARARLEREPKAAAQLHHPHIVPVYDAGFVGDQFFIASAFIEGRTLDAALGGSSMNPVRAALIVEKLADALDYAHRLGIVHRDVKPSNVMLDAQDEPHLFDFGLAHWQTPEDENLTTDGSLMGTPAYMSPEQAGAPVGDVGPASDEYALGVILYELLCGKRPFDGPPLTVMYQIREQEPERLGRRAPHVPRDLEAVCHKALEKRPQARYALCGELAADLRRWRRGETVRARRPGPIERARRWAGRHRALAATFALAVLLAVASTISAVGFRTFYNRAADHAQRAETALADLQRETQARRTTESKLQDRETKVAEQEKLLTTRAAELKQRDAALSAKDQTLATRNAKLKKLSADLAKGQTELDQSKKLLATREQELAGAITARDAAVSQAPWLAYVAHLQKAQAFLVDGKTQEAQVELDACDEKTRDTEWKLLKAVADGRLSSWRLFRASDDYDQFLVNPVAKLAFAGYKRGGFAIVDLVRGRIVGRGEHGFKDVHFSPDGKLLAMISNGALYVYRYAQSEYKQLVITPNIVRNTSVTRFKAVRFPFGSSDILVYPEGNGPFAILRFVSENELRLFDVGRGDAGVEVSRTWSLIGGKRTHFTSNDSELFGSADLFRKIDCHGSIRNYCVAVHPNRPVVVVGDGIVFDLTNQSPYEKYVSERNLNQMVRPLAFDDDGSRMGAMHESKAIFVYKFSGQNDEWHEVIRLDPRLFPTFSVFEMFSGMESAAGVDENGDLHGWTIK